MKALRLLRLAEVCRRVGYSRPWLYRLERAGKFPARVQVGPNRIAWVESEIDQWIAAKAAERDSRERELADIAANRYRWRPPAGLAQSDE